MLIQVRHEEDGGEKFQSTETVVFGDGVRGARVLPHGRQQQRAAGKARRGFCRPLDRGAGRRGRYRPLQVQGGLPQSAHPEPADQPDGHR